MTIANVKTCPGCRCQFSKDMHESRRRWAERINCSRACSNSTRLGTRQPCPKVDPNIKRRFRRRPKPWSEAEVAILRAGIENGFSAPVIARGLPGRSRDTVRQKAEQLKICRGEVQAAPRRVPVSSGSPHARILELHATGLGETRIVSALVRDFPGLKYRDVHAVLDRRTGC